MIDVLVPSPATTPDPTSADATVPVAAASGAWKRVDRSARVRLGVFAGMFGVLGAVVAARHGAAPPDLPSLAGALGVASDGTVSPDDIRWEPSEGVLADAIDGRWVLFLSVAPADGTHDVWRARVRVSPEGHPIQIAEAHDLTTTPLGDDHTLVLRDRHAAFATTAYGQVQSVTLLDLSGEGAENKAVTSQDRAMAWATNVQKTGSGAGIARFDVTLERPARAAGLAIDDRGLAINLADERVVRHAVLGFDGELTTGADGVHADSAMHLPKRLSHWTVDTLRAIPWIGPAPIAWLEDNVFALKDDVKRLAFKASGSDAELAGPREPPPSVLDTSEASVDAAHWPPANIPSIWKTPEAGEGEWVPPTQTWLRKVPGTDASAPTPFMTTFVRPDEERAYSKVLLVAMDMRQLDIDMEAGSEDPQPLTGPTGPGKLPRDPAIDAKVVACFNGAFKTEHGHYGMMVHKRVLLPPQPGAASVITTKDGRVGLGSWGTNKTVGGLTGIADDDIVSFRQNLDALVDHGEVNPSGRSLWGYSAPGKGIQTERTALCVTDAGHLVYAWGDDVSATTLAKGMKMAGCSFAMHLDMNPFHTGFLFTNITNVEKKQYKAELLTSGMEIPTARFIEWSPKDFFYVMVHDPTPPALDGASAWRPDGGTQPAPSWMAGLWASEINGARGDVDVVDIEPGRATWRIRAGAYESPGTSPVRELSDDDKKKVLLAVGLGVATERHPRGFATDGKLAVPVRGGDDGRGQSYGVIVADAAGRLAIDKAGDAPTVDAGLDLAEVPIILDAGAVIPAVISEGPGATIPRAALCIVDGRVLLARGSFASVVPLAEALKHAGCTRAVALDRGSHDPAFLHRTGGATAPLSRYDESVLYAMATPLAPRGFRFDPQTPVPPPATPKH